MQTIISALGGFLLKLLTCCIYYVTIPFLALPHGYPRAKEKASMIRKKIMDGHVQVLLAALRLSKDSVLLPHSVPSGKPSGHSKWVFGHC